MIESQHKRGDMEIEDELITVFAELSEDETTNSEFKCKVATIMLKAIKPVLANIDNGDIDSATDRIDLVKYEVNALYGRECVNNTQNKKF